MTALRDQAPGAGPGNAFPSTSDRPQARRSSGASRPVGAAGQARRSLQRDLARREAGLRISRRVSGLGTAPVAEVAGRRLIAPLPAFMEPETTTGSEHDAPVAAHPPSANAARIVSPRAPAPAMLPAPAMAPALAAPTPMMPGWRPDLGSPAPAPSPRRGPGVRSRPVAGGPQRRMSGAAPQGRPASARLMPQARIAPQARAAAPTQKQRTPPAAAQRRPMPAVPPNAAGRMVALAAAPVDQPGRLPLPFSLPRRALRALPGGSPSTAARARPKLSSAAIFVMAISLLVVTIGGVVALQIRVTQVNERMGADLGAITTLQQQNIALRERLTRQTTSAVVDNVAANRKMIEPDVSDTTFRSAGNRQATAAKAAAVLRTVTVAPLDGAASTTSTVAP